MVDGLVQEEDFEGEESPGYDDIIRAKWTIDGATTLGEAATKLREFADDLEKREREGWRLTQPVEDDYGFLVKA